MNLTLTGKAEKLARLGIEYERLLEMARSDCPVPGICTNRACDFESQVRPNERGGYCDNCEDNTVQSVLILAGMTS